MLYTCCNKFGETSDKQISDSDPKFTQADATAFRDKDGRTIYAVTFGGGVHFAIDETELVEAPVVSPDSDTDELRHVPAADDNEEPSSD